MTIIDALVLSIVEGITEFLPISSTGHLILTSHLLQVTQNSFYTTFEIFIQLGGILAVVALYFNTLLKRKDYWPKIFAAFIPTAAVGLLLYKFIKNFLLGNELITVISLCIGGIVLIALEYIHKEKEDHKEDIADITYKQAVLIGLCQSVSIVPGVSRAAASIIGGLFVGMKRKAAVEFSFFLAIPTIAAAAGLDLIESKLQFSNQEIMLLGVGFVGSFIVAIFAIKFFIAFIKTHSFIPFGIYRIVLAILYFIFILR
jgi:undecaprenyl-diphosphatase